MRRTRRYGKGDRARIKEEGDAVMARLADLLAEGEHAAGRAAMDLAEGLAAFVQDAILANEARWRSRQ